MQPQVPIRLIAFDLDGTTLYSGGILSPRNQHAIEQAAAQGLYPVPATGRVKNFLSPPIAGLSCLQYAITSNGGAIWDLRRGERIWSDLIPTEVALQVQAIFDEYPLYVEYYVNGTGVTLRENPSKAVEVYGFPKEKLYFLTKNYSFVDNLSDFLRETGAQPEKINMMFIPEHLREEILHRLEQLDVELTYSNVDNIEINAKGCNKGKAVLALAERLGIDPLATMAVGDNGNDLGMLRAAGFSVVVGNGIQAAKDEADAIVAPCSEDGFAEAVERFALQSENQ